MSYPPASQYLTSDTLKFTNTDGTPMRIFAEAGEIQDRPMLMRRLKKYGATICHEPRDAQIILVDPSTVSGRRFIRDWGQDANKVVLSSIWVRRSIEAGYPLSENEQWGECLAIDDGLPIGTGDEDEDNGPKSSLPTPRTTPVDQQNASSSTVPHTQPQTILESNPQPQIGLQMPIDVMAQAAAMQQALSLSANVAAGAQGPGVMPFMPTPFNMGLNFTGAMLPQPQQAMLLSILNSSFGAAMAQNFNIALQDVLSRTPTEAHAALNTANVNFDHNTSSVSTTQATEPSNERRLSSKRPRSTAESSSSSSESEPEPEPAQKSRKGKQKQVLPSTTTSQLFVSPSGEPYTFYLQIEIPQRQELVNNIKKNGGKLEQNHELADYVILHKRTAAEKSSKTLIQSIYANGKVPLSSRFVRDCVDRRTLLDESSYEIENVHVKKRKRRVNTNVAPSKEEYYSEGEAERERERRREEQRLARNKRRQERRRREREEQRAASPRAEVKLSPQPDSLSNKAKAPTNRGSSDTVKRYPSPPTPPLPHTKIALHRGYRFSDAEDEYALKCAKLLIDHDYTVSTTAICAYIHKTLSHHTARSWVTHFASLQPDEVNKWRKASAIRFRKAQALGNVKQEDVDDAQRLYTSPSPMLETHEPPPPVVRKRRALSEGDVDRHMNIVAQFFADGNDDDQEVPPSVLWERLSVQVPERTGPGWEEFYNKHHEVITERYNALLELDS